jgi:hypothetical protein
MIFERNSSFKALLTTGPANRTTISQGCTQAKWLKKVRAGHSPTARQGKQEKNKQIERKNIHE